MVKSGTVNSDSSKYESTMKNCQATFEGLSSDWKGPSREKLLETVSSFISESEIVVSQMSNLSQACAKHEAYVPLARRCKELRRLIQNELSKKPDENGNGGPNESQIVAWERELNQKISLMKQLNAGAKNLISQINGEVADVDIGNTDFVSGTESVNLV